VKAIGAVATAMSTGALTPEEALTVAGVIELRRKAIETLPPIRKSCGLKG